MMANARVVVIRRAWHNDIVREYLDENVSPQGLGPCQEFKDGDSFLVEGRPGPQKPAGFPCDWAWADLQRALTTILLGGEAPWINRPGAIVACCTDGLRPVTFLVQRIESQPKLTAFEIRLPV
jgi:uncharacterized repeat protein (TIGR04076 family)